MQLLGASAGGRSVQERRRELIAGPLTIDYFMQRAADGWRLVAVEWVREAADSASTGPDIQVSTKPEEIPFGLRVAEDGMNLERNPLEMTVLLLILDEIVKEKRITEIAADLNRSGYRTREGLAWSASAVFEMLPRLIEVGPALLKSAEWRERRPGSTAAN